MKNYCFIAGIVFIVFITSLAIGDIGELPKHCEEPYTWETVFLVFSIMALPFALGYLGRK